MKENTSKEKQKYEPPKIFRVVLNHDQAILSGCTTSTTAVSAGGSFCRPTCRNSSTSSADSLLNS